MKAIFNAILLMLSLTITVAATAGISEIKLDNGGIYTLKITDGMSGKTLEGVLSKNNADELQWKGENGIICHIKTTTTANGINSTVSFSLQPGQSGVRLLNVELNAKTVLSGNIMFWDGFEEHKFSDVKKSIGRDKLTETFPLSCIYDDSNGIALGITPDTITSFLSSEAVVDGKRAEMFYRTKVVVDNRRTQQVGFTGYGFKPEFGWRNAIHDYYASYPAYFRPHAGIDERIYGVGGNLVSAHMQQGLELHTARKTMLSWEWSYAPWVEAGNWYAEKKEWQDGIHEFDKWYGYRKPKKVTWEEFSAATAKRMESGDRMCAMMFYVLVKDIHENIMSSYTDAKLVDKHGRLFGKSGLYSIVGNKNKTYLAFAYGSNLANYLENKIRKVVENYQVSGFAFDMANLAENNYCPSQLNYAVGRCFDGKGNIYTPDSVLPIPFAEYIHTLKRDGKTMATYMNFALEKFVAFTVFHADGVMFEGPPECYISNIQALRLMSGQKPFTFWGNVTQGMSNTAIKWDYCQNPAVKKHVEDGLAQLLLFKCLEYGATPMNWAATYQNNQFFGKWINVLIDLKKAGWQPVSAVKGRNTEQLWIGRFGSGADSIITISNPTREAVNAQFKVIHSYIGNKKYFFIPVGAQKLKQIVSSTETDFSASLAPKEIMVLKAIELEGVGGATINTSSASGKDSIDFETTEGKSCSIKGKRRGFADDIINSVKDSSGKAATEIEKEYFMASGIDGKTQLALQFAPATSLFSKDEDIAGFFALADSMTAKLQPVIVLAKQPSQQEKTIAAMIDRYYPYVEASMKYCGKKWTLEPGFLDPKFTDINQLRIVNGDIPEQAKKIYVGTIAAFPQLTAMLSAQDVDGIKLKNGGFIKVLNDGTLWIGGKDAGEVFRAGQKYFELLDQTKANKTGIDFRK